MKRVIVGLCMCGIVAAPRAQAQQVEGADRIRATVFDSTLHIVLDSARRLPSGVYVLDVTPGTGPVMVASRPIQVQFAAWIASGVQVQPTTDVTTVTLGAGVLLPAVESAIVGMQVGGRRRMLIPPELAYGDRDTGAIPANSVLIVDITLVGQPE